jgi:monoamine oxidase
MSEKVIIIGAGAAGIGAGLELQALGIPFVIIEASNRIGGRAYTDKTSLRSHWDQGCGWFHCADVNPLVHWADRLRSVYDRNDRSKNALFWVKNRWLDMAESASVHSSINDRFNTIYAVAKKGLDVPISDVPAKAGIGEAIAEEMVRLMCSDDTKYASAVGYGDYNDTEVNWAVTSGYGDLINRMATGLPIHTRTEVASVEYHRGGVRVQTNSGQIDGRATIVTASTNVLRSGKISFPSGPVQTLLDLVEDVPCGTYEKVALALKHYPLDPKDNEALWVHQHSRESPIYFQIIHGNQPMMIAHISGDQARGLIAAGPQEMADFAIQKLKNIFGSHVQDLICGTAVTGWQTNPLIQGGYSYARTGAGQNRRKMITLDTGVITFAGEAFSLPWYGTAHGAYESGKCAASRLQVLLNLKPAS